MHSCWFRPQLLIVSLSFACLLLPTQAVQVLPYNLQEEVKRAEETGRLPAKSRLHLAIGLPLRNPEALTNLLNRLYDPGSPAYRQFLSAAEFAEKFGPSETDYAAAIDFVRRHGLQILATHPNRVLLEFDGTVEQIENAFRIRLKQFRHPRERREFYAPDTAPSLDLEVPLVSIAGLDNFVVPRPANLLRKAETDCYSEASADVREALGPRALAGSGPGGSYLGLDFRAAYAPDVLLNGAGQYVGLVQFDGYYPNDIGAYVGRAGLTNVALTNILLNGFDGTPGENNVEVALDIEVVIAMAPGLSGVMVYEGRLANSILNRMATDNIARQLSASWTFGTDAATTQIFQQFAAQGQSYFNASGDDGAYTGPPLTPTDNPYITSVGGTTLSTRGPGAAWLSETTWNWYNTGSGTQGSGGGVSASWSIPSWQQGIDMSTNRGSVIGRNIPDVAMVADNVFVIADNGQQTFVGGTSVASPLWAAYMALVNQQAALAGSPSVGFLNPSVYALGKSTNYASAFHDIRTGNNTNPASPNLFHAVGGYDLCTGWGTPTGKRLINALAPPPDRPVLVPGGATLVLETCGPTNGVADPGEAVTMRFELQNFGGVSTTNLVATLLAGDSIVPLSPSQSYGAIAQGATATRQFSFIPNGACGGSATAKFHVQDGLSDLGTVSFSLPLGAPKNALAEHFDGVPAPSIPPNWTSLAVNSVSNWVTSTSARDSTPNSAFAFPSPVPGECELISPAFPVNSASAQLTFRHRFNLESDPTEPTSAFDGGALELKIGDGPARDILVEGGSFVEGGYTHNIQAGENPLDGRQVWSGDSGSFIKTVVNLPASAAGQMVVLKWRLGLNNGRSSSSGWWVDSIAVKDGYACCPVSTTADIAVSQNIYPQPAVLGQSVAFTLTVQNLGPGPALAVNLTNVLPENAVFEWASPGYTNLGNAVAWELGLLPLGRATNLTLLMKPTLGDFITNAAAVATASDDPTLTNNISIASLPIARPPVFTFQPTNQFAVMGGDVAFYSLAEGTEPLRYQWRFQGVNLDGATNSSLFLTNVQPAQTGIYSVQVANSAGSSNSLAANLTVQGPPVLALSAVDISGTNVAVSLTGLVGFAYTLEYKDTLADLAWLPIEPPVAGTGDVILLRDTSSPVPQARFYRVNATLSQSKQRNP